MNEINNVAAVRSQYAGSGNLSTRISIHARYSTNKLGFGNWIFSHCPLEDGGKVLELGCGTGEMWLGHEDKIHACSQLILSDFSPGILEAAKANISGFPNVRHMLIDIQDIPFEDASFDLVIANMMLYHVPDLRKGLSEVRRILRPGGKFCCATYGEHGIMEYLSLLLKDYGVVDNGNRNFTLQNGAAILRQFFPHVQKLEYPDSLAVTDPDDMVDYIYSLSSMTALSNIPRNEIRAILTEQMTDGILHVPKEYGMFIAF